MAGQNHNWPGEMEPVPPDEVRRLFGRDDEELREKIVKGEVRLVALSQGVALELEGRPGTRRDKAQAKKPEICREHIWKFDCQNFQVRYCSRPGCRVRQRFEWAPEDRTRQGAWVDLSPTQRQRQRQRKNLICNS